MPKGKVETENNERSWNFRQSANFVKIDRKQENENVVNFQQTKKKETLEELYYNRIPTLQIWSKRYSYLTNDSDDMFEELVYHFIKAVYGYKQCKGSFNTFLFTSLLNCVRNIRSGQLAKKRIPEGMESESPLSFLLSLDYNYDKKDGEESTLKDILANKIATEDSIREKISIDETIEMICKNDPHMKIVLKKLSDGETIASVIKESKTKHGRVKLSRVQAGQLKKNRKCNKTVSKIIDEKGLVCGEFDLMSYRVSDTNNLHYVIELKKTKESDAILRTIRKFRRNKDYIIEQIGR